MNAAYLRAIATSGAALVTHLGLVDEHGAELARGSYARKPVAWVIEASGMLRPATDLTFNIPAGAGVAGWRGYSAASGGTDFGGESLPLERFNGQGQYTLLAKGTGIAHRVSA